MATKNPDSAPRLGGVLISNQVVAELLEQLRNCLLYTSPSPRD
mgnify:FL=1